MSDTEKHLLGEKKEKEASQSLKMRHKLCIIHQKLTSALFIHESSHTHTH